MKDQTASFDLLKHFLEISEKINRFIKDFDILPYIQFKEQTKRNPCLKCHYQKDEPFQHKLAKEKIFNLFVNEPDYLILTELHAKVKELQVFDKGLRAYQFDCLIVDIKLFSQFNYLMTSIKMGKVLHIDQYYHLFRFGGSMIFAVELDGGHSKRKDNLRDAFFMEEYAIPTARYEVSDLVSFHKKYRGKYGADPRHMQNYTKEVQDKPYLWDLNIKTIEEDAIALFHKKLKR